MAKYDVHMRQRPVSDTPAQCSYRYKPHGVPNRPVRNKVNSDIFQYEMKKSLEILYTRRANLYDVQDVQDMCLRMSLQFPFLSVFFQIGCLKLGGKMMWILRRSLWKSLQNS